MELEILSGAPRNPEIANYAFFYFRDPITEFYL